ncbi:MAG: deoxynucleoside kinase [Marinilabiliaceae bacterium]|jgi:deoxyadenosine/deoxycytidine kinase|nr:deoxynucleoside kinase [Marinilabiliaceae bacterium]
MNSRYKYIVIEGNIGAGKTSLATLLSEEFEAKLLLERFADNPFLPKFYENPARYSFPLELSFLADRYQQLKEELGSIDMFSPFTIADYYFNKSLVFASSTLEEEEYKLYRQIFHIIIGSLPKPDLYVYLHVDPSILLENIALRGRNYEKSITKDYLTRIQESYLTYFKQNSGYRYLIIDSGNIDFVNRKEDYMKIKEAIFETEHPVGINRLFF